MITIPPTALATVVLVWFGCFFFGSLFGGFGSCILGDCRGRAVDGMSGLFVFCWRRENVDLGFCFGFSWCLSGFALGGVYLGLSLYLVFVEHTLVWDSMLGRWEVIGLERGGAVYGRLLGWLTDWG